MSTPDRASSRARALALEETAEDLYEHAPCGYLSTLPDGEIIKINTTLLGWLGLNRGDVVGKWRFEDLLSVGGRIYHETHFSPLLRMQGEVRSIALDLVTTAGTRLPVLVNAVLKTGAEDEPLLVRMVVVEVRDRRSYERELLRARRAADEQTRLRQRWVEASGEITTALLAGAGPGEALGLVARRAAELTGASGALITTPVTTAAHGEAPPVRVMVAVGFDDRYPAGTPLPVGGTVLGAVARTGAPHAVDDLVLAPGHAGEGSGLAVLMRAGEETSGVLVVSGVDAGADSIRDGLSILASFADQAALVLRYAESQRALRELDVLADRERIAADLHDHVLQRLFALGLGLQAVHARLASSDAARRVDEAVDQIDGIVRDIRSAIFDLHNSRAGGELAARVRAAATGMAADTDVEPVVRVSGEVEAVPEDLVVAVEAVVREGVSNAVRHAAPSQITVTVSTDTALTVEVVDDGLGIPEPVARSGLANLAARARAVGGDLRVARRPLGPGTRLTWWVPLDLRGRGDTAGEARPPSSMEGW